MGKIPESTDRQDVIQPVGPIVIERVLIQIPQLNAQRFTDVNPRANEGSIPVRSSFWPEIRTIQVYEDLVIHRN